MEYVSKLLILLAGVDVVCELVVPLGLFLLQVGRVYELVGLILAGGWWSVRVGWYYFQLVVGRV